MAAPPAGPVPGAAACAAIVARDDPPLHATALFAAQPARARLMVLYAFDVELSRAASASAESLIPRMRLQWWRDVVAAADAGAPPPAHEVAGPLAALVAAHRLPADRLAALIEAREVELEAAGGGLDEAGFAAWADDRFGALTGLAAHLLSDGDPATTALARRAGPVLGAAFALRHAVPMAAAGRSLLPGLAPADRAALAGGDMTADTAATVRRLAGEALATLAGMRADRGTADRRATPAFLPLARAGRDLERAVAASAGRAPAGLGDRPFDGLRLALRAATGRW